jgi:hypothetical protein
MGVYPTPPFLRKIFHPWDLGPDLMIHRGSGTILRTSCTASGIIVLFIIRTGMGQIGTR